MPSTNGQIIYQLIYRFHSFAFTHTYVLEHGGTWQQHDSTFNLLLFGSAWALLTGFLGSGCVGLWEVLLHRQEGKVVVFLPVALLVRWAEEDIEARMRGLGLA
jgi:hypothetical protein